MSRNLAAIELKVEHLRAFPTKETGILFHSLWSDFSMLRLHWGMFRELFNGDPNRVELLKWAAPTFFLRIKRILSDDILLRLGRLTDPPKSAGKETASFAQIVELIGVTDHEFATQCKIYLSHIDESCQAARVLRNRSIAHKDPGTLTAASEGPLPAFNNRQVNETMERIAELLNLVEKRFGLNRTAWVESRGNVIHDGGVDALIAALELAREKEENDLSELGSAFRKD